jgi:hypothetical protein
MKPNLKQDFHRLLTAAKEINDILATIDLPEFSGGAGQKQAFDELVNDLYWKYSSHAGAPIDELNDREFAKHLRHVRITEENHRPELQLLDNL